MPIAENIPTLQELAAFRGRTCKKLDVMKSSVVRFTDSAGRIFDYPAERLSKTEIQKALGTDPNDVFNDSAGGDTDMLNLLMNLNYGIGPNSPPDCRTELAEKSVDDSVDENACFDSAFPFFRG